VLEAKLKLDARVDPAAVGAAVTKELCGHWEHEGGCRWPHNNELLAEDGTPTSIFRTVFLAVASEEPEVRTRIEKALNAHRGWSVEETRSRELRQDEAALAARLAGTPPPLEG
jgi:hypothetical protein